MNFARFFLKIFKIIRGFCGELQFTLEFLLKFNKKRPLFTFAYETRKTVYCKRGILWQYFFI